MLKDCIRDWILKHRTVLFLLTFGKYTILSTIYLVNQP